MRSSSVCEFVSKKPSTIYTLRGSPNHTKQNRLCILWCLCVVLCVTYNWLVSHFQTCSTNVRRLLILHYSPNHIICIFSLVVCLRSTKRTTYRKQWASRSNINIGPANIIAVFFCVLLVRSSFFFALMSNGLYACWSSKTCELYLCIHPCWPSWSHCSSIPNRRMPHTISLSPFYIIISSYVRLCMYVYVCRLWTSEGVRPGQSIYLDARETALFAVRPICPCAQNEESRIGTRRDNPATFVFIKWIAHTKSVGDLLIRP